MMSILPRQIPDILALARSMNKPVMLHGSPGIGKTQSITQYAEGASLDLKTLLLTTKTPADLGGLCALDHERKMTVFYMPEFFPRDPESKGVLFFDELSSADDAVRLAAYSIIQERRQGDYKLPDGWQIVAAGNRPEDGCPAYDMGRAMNDRFMHVLVEVSAKDWLEWADTADIEPSVSAFIALNPQRLTATATEIQKSDVVLPTPRSWEAVSRACKATQDEELLGIAVGGLVGEIGAHAFLTFRTEARASASVGTILKTPIDKLSDVLPNTLSGLYTLMYGFAAVVSKSNLKAMFDVFGVMEELANDPRFSSIQMFDIQSLGMTMALKKIQEKKGGPIIDISTHPVFKRYVERERIAS
jgi:hypothetical protein